MAFNKNKTRKWDRTTPNDGQLFDLEFNRLYDNDIALDQKIIQTEKNIMEKVVPVGSITVWPIEEIPAGWLECNGASLNKNIYSDLYSVIGSTYNIGNEIVDYFSIPDYRYIFLRSNGSANPKRYLGKYGTISNNSNELYINSDVSKYEINKEIILYYMDPKTHISTYVLETSIKQIKSKNIIILKENYLGPTVTNPINLYIHLIPGNIAGTFEGSNVGNHSHDIKVPTNAVSSTTEFFLTSFLDNKQYNKSSFFIEDNYSHDSQWSTFPANISVKYIIKY